MLRLGEEVSSRPRPGQAGLDNPVLRRAPPDRAGSRRTGAVAKVCKLVRVDRPAGPRV